MVLALAPNSASFDLPDQNDSGAFFNSRFAPMRGKPRLCVRTFIATDSLDYWQLSQLGFWMLQALATGSTPRSTLMLLDADLFFIQRGCMPRRFTSSVDFSICVAATVRR